MRPNVCEGCGLVGLTHADDAQCLAALKHWVGVLEERQSGLYRSATWYAVRGAELERKLKQAEVERDQALQALTLLQLGQVARAEAAEAKAGRLARVVNLTRDYLRVKKSWDNMLRELRDLKAALAELDSEERP